MQWRMPRREASLYNIRGKAKKLDSRGIEPRTTPMLREYYTTKPQAHFDDKPVLQVVYDPFGNNKGLGFNLEVPVLQRMDPA